MTPALACIDVTKKFEPSGRGVFHVSLTVPAGFAYAMLGPNGSGKTTIINLCLGYLVPDSGRIEIDGRDIAEATVESKMLVAYVPEIARLYPHLSALEHFIFFDRLLGHGRRTEIHHAVLELLQLSTSAAADPVGTYSKGMRQKTAIALGLLKGAEVFLLDEPTSGLDPRSAAEFGNVVRRLKSQGKAILLSTHDILGIASVADRVGVLENGRIVQECAPDDLARLFAETR